MKKPPYSNVDGVRLIQNAFTGVVTATSGPFIEDSGSFSSVNTPGFKALPKRLRPENPFLHTRNLTVYTGDGHWETMIGVNPFDKGFNYGGPTGTLSGTFSNPPVLVTSADEIAKKKLLSYYSRSSINLAQSFAERRQTVGLLATSVNRLATVALAIRRGNLYHAAKLLAHDGTSVSASKIKKFRGKDIKPGKDNLSNWWLEYSYGWRPLVNDIYGSCEVLADTFYRKYPTKVSAQHSSSSVSRHDLLGVKGDVLWKEYGDTLCNERVKYKLEYIEDEELLSVLSRTGLTNPALLAWELVPYSFCVDWILPVGSYLQALTANNGLLFLRGSKTTLRTSVTQTYWEPGPSGAGGINVYKIPTRTITKFRKERILLTSFPSPTFPSFRPLDKISQVLSSLALLNQTFKR